MKHKNFSNHSNSAEFNSGIKYFVSEQIKLFVLLPLTIRCLGAIKHPVLASVQFISTASIGTVLENRVSTVRSLKVGTSFPPSMKFEKVSV